jgi:hypothetical protein
VPLGVTTWTVPVVAPAGTVALMTELSTVNVAGVPDDVTLLCTKLESREPWKEVRATAFRTSVAQRHGSQTLDRIIDGLRHPDSSS